MIAIRSIDYVKVDGTPENIYKFCYQEALTETPMEVETANGTSMMRPTEVLEIIRGRKFMNPATGEHIVIGLSKQAQKLLGLNYEAWDNLQKDLKWYQTKHNKLINEARELQALQEASDKLVGSYQSAPWYQRLLWVFVGIPKQEENHEQS